MAPPVGHRMRGWGSHTFPGEASGHGTPWTSLAKEGSRLLAWSRPHGWEVSAGQPSSALGTRDLALKRERSLAARGRDCINSEAAQGPLSPQGLLTGGETESQGVLSLPRTQ